MYKEKKTIFRLIVATMALCIFFTVFAGCSSKDPGDKNETTSAQTTSAAASAGDPTKVYPIATNEKLTLWVALGSDKVTNYSETNFAKELEKRTGVKIEYIHPVGNGDDAFNLMISSGDLPDMISYVFSSGYPGGPGKAINDGIIVPLNSLVEKNAPNFAKILQDDAILARDLKTDNGDIYVFPALYEKIHVTYGAMVRKDWLDSLNMTIPTTFTEWEAVLKAFKDNKGAEAPFSNEASSNIRKARRALSVFAAGFNVKLADYPSGSFYQSDGKVACNLVSPEYKDFLALMNKWYKEGLLDKNFSTNTREILDANITSGKSGATCEMASGGLGSWMSAMEDKDPKFELVAVPYPTKNKGDKPMFGKVNTRYFGLGTAITTKCKNQELAAKFLDYIYSDEGILFCNYGIEGESFTYKDGKPVFTDLINNNQQGLTPLEAQRLYTPFARSPEVGIQRFDYLMQLMLYKQSADAMKIWDSTDEIKYLMPNLTHTTEESDEMAKIVNDIDTYSNEMFLKFIMGSEPLDNYDKYVEQMNKLNISRIIELKQAALDRYNKK